MKESDGAKDVPSTFLLPASVSLHPSFAPLSFVISHLCDIETFCTSLVADEDIMKELSEERGQAQCWGRGMRWGNEKKKKKSSPQPDKDMLVRAGFSSTLFVRLIYDNI